MELKWLAVMMIGIFGAMFVGMGIESYNRQECRIAAIKANMPVDDIAKACK